MATSEPTKTKTKAKTKTAKELAQESFDALARHDLGYAERFWGPDSVDHFLPVGAFRGKDAIVGYFRELMAAFPDFEIDVERIVGEGDVAVVQWRARGTFSGGPFMGIEPTGRPVEMRGIDVMEWRDGMLAHNTIYYDGAELGRQIGMLPRRDSIADRAMLAGFNAVSKLRARMRSK